MSWIGFSAAGPVAGSLAVQWMSAIALGSGGAVTTGSLPVCSCPESGHVGNNPPSGRNRGCSLVGAVAGKSLLLISHLPVGQVPVMYVLIMKAWGRH